MLHASATDEESYYALRKVDPETLDPVGRAARFIYLNRLCFNGLYRTDQKGRFNVPYGTRTGRFPTEAHLYRCSVALRDADLRCGDFAETTSDAGQGDFVYLDPPYTRSPEHAYGVYGYGSFSAEDMSRMLTALHSLDRAGATFLFSYADIPTRCPAPRYLGRAPGHRARQIAARVSARSLRAEVLITNRVLGTAGATA